MAGNAIGPSRVDLSWTASNDNVGVAGYTIYRDGSAHRHRLRPDDDLFRYHGEPLDHVRLHRRRFRRRPEPLCAVVAASGVTTPAAGDTQPPTVPTGLAASVISPSRVDLTWNTSTDNVGVSGYTVYRNGAVLANVGSTSFSDLSGDCELDLQLPGRCASAQPANHSAQSSAVSVTMPGAVFSDDFETGNLSKWTAMSGMTVQQQVTYAGSWAARGDEQRLCPPTPTRTSATTVSELYYDGRFQM